MFIRSYSLSVRVLQFNPSTPFTYTIAGAGVSSSGTRGQNLVLTKGGTTRYIFNKTSGEVTKLVLPKVQWTPGPTSVGGSPKRKALVQRRAVEAKDIGADVPASMGKSPPPRLGENLSTNKKIMAFIIFLLNIPNTLITYIKVPGLKISLMPRVALILASRISWLSSKAPS